MSKDEYDIGYKKPPKHSRFKPGQSGNPKGRPKGSLNFKTLVELQGKVRHKITVGDKTKSLSQNEIAVMQVWKKAMQGDLRAFTILQQMESDAILQEVKSNPIGKARKWPPDPETLRFTLKLEEDDPRFGENAQFRSDDYGC